MILTKQSNEQKNIQTSHGVEKMNDATILKEPFSMTKEEKELFHKIGAAGNYKDHNFEKNKFLETIYEKLHHKDSSNLRDQTSDYCVKFLNFSIKEVDEMNLKYKKCFI